jgi:two-component system, sensor histidine kinase ChiS
MFQNLKIKSVRILTSLSLVHILFIMLGPVVRYYELFTPIFIINIIVLSLEVVVLFLKSALKNNDGSIFLLLSILAIVNRLIGDCSKISIWLKLPIILLT